MIDKNIKNDFPIFEKTINGKPLIYLDNAATSQLPLPVLSAIFDFETKHRANVHRGAHTLSGEATDMYEKARETVSEFVGAVIPSEIVFTKNATEAINLAAFSWAKFNLNKGDIILVSGGEHHSNLLPWQMVCSETESEMFEIPIDEDGFVDYKNINVDWTRVKFIALSHVSNVFGVENDIREFVKFAKRRVFEARKLKEKKEADEYMPKILVDASQSVPHFKVNVQKLGIDFLVFSGHKMCGPMGIGVLWISRDLFKELHPFNTGGGMINKVQFAESTFGNMPDLLEAGTPNVSGAIGLAAGVKYLENIGMENIALHERELVRYFFEKIKDRKDIIIYGSKNPEVRLGVIAFNIKGKSAHDVAVVLDSEGVAVRSGHHCVMPWHMKQEYKTTVRASFYFYNTKEDIDILVQSFDKVHKLLG
jgi:cysteine desulfurase/selenocysteine lyase